MRTPAPRRAAYLDGLASPKITGIGAGEKLRIIWLGARETISGPSEFSAETLPLMSLLRDQMLHALLAEVERMSNTPLPPQQRAERMTVLEEEEVDQLQRVEEALIAREGAERSTNCAPAAVLGVRVIDAHGIRAA